MKFSSDPGVVPEGFCGDAGLYARCLELLLGDEGFPLLRAAIGREDWDVARECALTLSGLAENLGLSDLRDAARSLMSLLPPGADRAALDGAYLALLACRDGVAALWERLS